MKIINKNKQKKAKITRLFILGCFIALAIWLYWGNHAIEVTPFTITDELIPEAFDGFKIVQVSDLHNAEFGANQHRLLQQIQAAEPDLIAVTGDLIDSRHTDLKKAMAFMEEAVTIAPVYYVTGNHEGRAAEYDELEKQLRHIGVTILNSETVTLTREGADLQVIGLADPVFAAATTAMMEQTLQDLKNTAAAYTLLLSHRPELIDSYAKCTVNLVLSGHAHGGQFRLPFIGGIVAPNQGFFPRYTEGIHKIKQTQMVVSRGLGNSLFPLRINNRPELVVITLHHAERTQTTAAKVTPRPTVTPPDATFLPADNSENDPSSGNNNKNDNENNDKNIDENNNENIKALLVANAQKISRGEKVALNDFNRVIDVAGGDLNQDGWPDLAVAVEQAMDGDWDFGERSAYILYNQGKNVYQVVYQNDSLILGSWAGGVIGDPFYGFSIAEGRLKLSHYGGSSARWGYDYIFAENGQGLQLVEYHAHSASTLTGNGTDTILNCLTGIIECYSYCVCDEDLSHDGLLLYRGEFTPTVSYLENPVLPEAHRSEGTPHAPDLYPYDYRRPDSPAGDLAADLNYSANDAYALLIARSFHEAGFMPQPILWTEETKQNYRTLLGYEMPDYYYENDIAQLWYCGLETRTDEDTVTALYHLLAVYYTPAANAPKDEVFRINAATGEIEK